MMPRSMSEMNNSTGDLRRHARNSSGNLSLVSELSDDSASGQYQLLPAVEIDNILVEMARPYTKTLDPQRGLRVDGLSFQPCKTARSQDRYVVEQFSITPGQPWTLTGVFDGHLGEVTVEHVAHHLPIIVKEFFEEAVQTDPSSIKNTTFISDLLRRAFSSFDSDIANDVLELFPGGIKALEYLSDEDIRKVINDYDNDLHNYRKVQLNMYGTTALIALVDPLQENLWVANLGDCQAVIASRDGSGGWTGELLTEVHNSSNPREVERVRREHPNEPDCIKNGRVLGAIAPFRCLGDQPFKQPPIFTRRILYNLDPGYKDIAPWEQFLARNYTPPYISADPDVVHRSLGPFLGSKDAKQTSGHFIILCTDGLQDLYDGISGADLAREYVTAVTVTPDGGSQESSLQTVTDNLAIRLLKAALGGEDIDAVSQLITWQSEEAWLDDITIVVQVL